MFICVVLLSLLMTGVPCAKSVVKPLKGDSALPPPPKAIGSTLIPHLFFGRHCWLVEVAVYHSLVAFCKLQNMQIPSFPSCVSCSQSYLDNVSRPWMPDISRVTLDTVTCKHSYPDDPHGN